MGGDLVSGNVYEARSGQARSVQHREHRGRHPDTTEGIIENIIEASAVQRACTNILPRHNLTGMVSGS